MSRSTMCAKELVTCEIDFREKFMQMLHKVVSSVKISCYFGRPVSSHSRCGSEKGQGHACICTGIFHAMVFWLQLACPAVCSASASVVVCLVCSCRMNVRRFYLLQCPASHDATSVDDCHRHAEKVTFALLNEYFRSFHERSLPNCVQKHIKVVASQVSREPDTDQWRVSTPQQCGRCLLHAVCGELIDHHLLDPLTKR